MRKLLIIILICLSRLVYSDDNLEFNRELRKAIIEYDKMMINLNFNIIFFEHSTLDEREREEAINISREILLMIKIAHFAKLHYLIYRGIISPEEFENEIIRAKISKEDIINSLDIITEIIY